jgi:hypothetical protein
MEEVEGKSDPQVLELHRLGGPGGRGGGQEWPPFSYTGEAFSVKLTRSRLQVLQATQTVLTVLEARGQVPDPMGYPS